MENPINRFNGSGSGRVGSGNPGFRPISHSRPLRFQIPAPEMFVENAVFQKMGNPTNRFNESGSGRVGSDWVGLGRAGSGNKYPRVPFTKVLSLILISLSGILLKNPLLIYCHFSGISGISKNPGFRPISHSRPLRFQIPAPEMFVGNAVF